MGWTRFLLSRRERITCPKRIANRIHAKHSGVTKIMECLLLWSKHSISHKIYISIQNFTQIFLDFESITYGIEDVINVVNS